MVFDMQSDDKVEQSIDRLRWCSPFRSHCHLNLIPKPVHIRIYPVVESVIYSLEWFDIFFDRNKQQQVGYRAGMRLGGVLIEGSRLVTHSQVILLTRLNSKTLVGVCPELESYAMDPFFTQMAVVVLEPFFAEQDFYMDDSKT
jgi:hypothetical protein